jgi:hypothetical protein
MRPRLFLGIALVVIVAALAIFWVPGALAQYPNPPDRPPAPHIVPHRLAPPAGWTQINAGGEIWNSNDGLNWTPVMTGGFGTLSNAEIMHLTVYSDTLYARRGRLGHLGGRASVAHQRRGLD